MKVEQKAERLKQRHRRVRKKIFGTPDRPRLAVYRSNSHVYAQVIDDVGGQTLAAASTLGDAIAGPSKEKAKRVGLAIAKRAKERGITQVTFDRGGFKFHGRVAEVAEGVREGGLKL